MCLGGGRSSQAGLGGLTFNVFTALSREMARRRHDAIHAFTPMDNRPSGTKLGRRCLVIMMMNDEPRSWRLGASGLPPRGTAPESAEAHGKDSPTQPSARPHPSMTALRLRLFNPRLQTPPSIIQTACSLSLPFPSNIPRESLPAPRPPAAVDTVLDLCRPAICFSSVSPTAACLGPTSHHC